MTKLIGRTGIACVLAAGALNLMLAAQAQAEMPATITLTLTTPDIIQIGDALREKPYKDVVNLLNKIQDQINAQTTKKPEAPTDAATEDKQSPTPQTKPTPPKP